MNQRAHGVGMRSGSRACRLLLLVAAFAASAYAELSPEAETAVARGLAAGKANDHRTAIDCFQEARRTSPDEPAIFFYLGVAESKLRGRELRAISWFGAYLSALPDAANSAPVIKQIELLKRTHRETLRSLIQTAQDSANALKTSGDTSLHLSSVARLWAEAGDFPAAFKAADLIDDAYGLLHWKPGALAAIARAQGTAGAFSDAMKTAASVLDPYEKYWAQNAIVLEQIKAGDLAGARDAWASVSKAPEMTSEANRLPVYIWMSSVASRLAEAQARAGDTAAAAATLEAIRELAGSIENAEHKATILEDIATATARLAKGELVTKSQEEQRNSVPPGVADWIENLDAVTSTHGCPLNTKLFLDLPAYLKSRAPTEDLEDLTNQHYGTADQILDAQKFVFALRDRQQRLPKLETP